MMIFCQVWMRLLVGTFVVILLLSNGVLVSVSAWDIKCNAKPKSGRHVEEGIGACNTWEEGDTEFGCCLFCKNLKAWASQLVPIGKSDPFVGVQFNDPHCCCYFFGRLYDGGDGTNYYTI